MNLGDPNEAQGQKRCSRESDEPIVVNEVWKGKSRPSEGVQL